MLFTGSYRRALDAKLRLPLPRPLRSEAPEASQFFLTPGLDGCLAAYPEAEFKALADRLGANSPGAREVRAYNRLFFSQAVCVVPDRQWRLRLPQELTEWAGLQGGVMLVGVRDHIEFWSVAKWSEFIGRCDTQFDALAELALVGGRTVPPATASQSESLGAPLEMPAAPTQPR